MNREKNKLEKRKNSKKLMVISMKKKIIRLKIY